MMLPALERPWAVRARQDRALLRQIHAALGGGPFHLIHGGSFADNLAAFHTALAQAGVDGRVYYGKKANKAGAWLVEAAKGGGAVDVASVPEFVHALGHGLTGADIGVTGAAKSEELLWLSSRHGALVAIDALDELERAIAIARTARPLRILLRVLPKSAPDSRFGLSDADLSAALALCAAAGDALVMAGFSFHLDGYAVTPRAQMAGELVTLCLAARGQGFAADTISIGGGFACAFFAESDWAAFKAALDPGLFHAGRQFSHFYPYHQAPTGAAMLKAILAHDEGACTLARRLARAGIALCLEPGRALLDGAGMSVFPVQGFKRNAAHGIVTVAGLSMSLSEQWKNSEFLPTPLLVQEGPERPQSPVEACVGGSSCMEYDILTWRKIGFPAAPRHGDFLVYPNTAGYQMDKNESTFHQLPLPPKIALTETETGFEWRIEP